MRQCEQYTGVPSGKKQIKVNKEHVMAYGKKKGGGKKPPKKY
jgi:hypothetical protein